MQLAVVVTAAEAEEVGGQLHQELHHLKAAEDGQTQPQSYCAAHVRGELGQLWQHKELEMTWQLWQHKEWEMTWQLWQVKN